MVMMRPAFYICCLTLFMSCEDFEGGHSATPYSEFSAPFNFGLFESPPNNPMTVEGIELGRKLFYETRLSRDATISCSSCHQQSKAFTDGKTVAIGIDDQKGDRSTMSLVNLLWSTQNMFWDGRAGSIEEQVLQPIANPKEMDLPVDQAVARLNDIRSYRDEFKIAFGARKIRKEHVAKALAQFIRSLVSQDSRYDKFLNGELQLSDSELSGMQSFFTHPDPSVALRGSNCGDCHRNFLTDGFKDAYEGFANNGIDDEDNLENGLFGITGNPLDKGKFKVPTLRNIALTAPYMHDGRFETLEEILDHYNEHIRESTTLDLLISSASNEPRKYDDPIGLKLTEAEKKNIIAFMHTLTDSTFIANEKHANPFTD